MFGAGHKPDIKYPKIKIKSKDEIEEEKKKIDKPCPQQTQIQYPKILKMDEEGPKPIELIGKKKAKEEIDKEMKVNLKLLPQKPKPGKDRKEMISNFI